MMIEMRRVAASVRSSNREKQRNTTKVVVFLVNFLSVFVFENTKQIVINLFQFKDEKAS